MPRHTYAPPNPYGMYQQREAQRQVQELAASEQVLANQYGNLGQQYGQYVNQIRNQPLPANTSGISNQMARGYSQAVPQMQGYYAQLADYADQMSDQQQAFARRMASMMDPRIGQAQRDALERLLQPPARRSESVYLFGY